MTTILLVLAAWFALSVLVGIGFGRAARLGERGPR